MPTNPDILAEVVRRGVESQELDYKAAMNWNALTRPAKAKLVRHCLAFANTKGGYIVIGVGEDASGHPSDYQGLTPEEVHSFDPSNVGPFINRHVEPAIDFDIERPEVEGKRYAIFVVRPFREVPHVCTSGVEGEVQTGVFYIRTSDAASRPAYRATEMHNLIQRALRNQREALGRMLRGILYESRSAQPSEAPDQFREQLDNSRIYFNRRKTPPPEPPMILVDFSVTPPDFNPERFSLSDIRRAVDAAMNLASSQFVDPDELPGTYLTNFSLRSFPGSGLRMWQVFQTGLFHYIGYWPVRGRKINCNTLALNLSEAVAFLARLYAELGYVDELLILKLRLEGTEDLMLDAGDGSDKYRSRIPAIEVELRRTAGDLASGVETHAARLVGKVAERFNLPDHEMHLLPRRVRQIFEKR